MSPNASSPVQTESTARTCIGYLALTYEDLRLPLQILKSAAGYYLGTAHEGEPVSRESHEYFVSHEAATRALAHLHRATGIGRFTSHQYHGHVPQRHRCPCVHAASQPDGACPIPSIKESL